MQQQTQQSQQGPQPHQTKKRWKNNENRLRSNNLLTGALLAVFLVILQTFIGIGLHNICSYIVIISLAVSGPCLASCIVIKTHEQKYPYRQSATIINTFYALGLLSGFIGLVATFWYMSPIVGIVFFGVSLIVFVFSILDVNHLTQDAEGKHMWR